MTARPVDSESIPMNNLNEESLTKTLQEFMQKYEKLDKDRKKYMICFFALFALVIIFLVIILVGLTANTAQSPSNIDTCNTECVASENNFVTLTETDTDIPVATYDAFLDVYLKNTSLQKSRVYTPNGTRIYDPEAWVDAYVEQLQLNGSLNESINGSYTDIYISVFCQVFQGNLDYDYLVRACNILYTGHSLFTFRFLSDASNSTSKTVGMVQITSEQCDDKVLNGLATNGSFESKNHSLIYECLDGDKGVCQIYLENYATFNLQQILSMRRRLRGAPDFFPPSGPSPEPTQSPEECFPSGTKVNTTDGFKSMEDLRIGDRVLSINRYTGELEYSDIYMFGHRIDDFETIFITLYTDNNNDNHQHGVSATSKHFIYTCDKKDCEWNTAVIKTFEKVKQGKDYIFNANMEKHLVIKKEINEINGIYAPFTINGNLIVNGEIVSCYAEWGIDDLIKESDLQIIYNGLVKPLIWFYQYLPNQWLWFNSLYPHGFYSAICQSKVFELTVKYLVFFCQFLCY